MSDRASPTVVFVSYHDHRKRQRRRLAKALRSIAKFSQSEPIRCDECGASWAYQNEHEYGVAVSALWSHACQGEVSDGVSK